MQKWTKTMMAGVIAGSLLLGSMSALAQSTYDPRIDAREQNQQGRIQPGVQSGQLTPREANRLEAQQGRIQATENRMKADGNLTRAERAKLARMQNRASRDIYRKKHNNRVY
ncbi:MAG: hypothetical protein M1438_13005 [Deltaproteobacteria bacterium]|nr:hypothetical protein [Deltaproteobacteria bacterium]